MIQSNPEESIGLGTMGDLIEEAKRHAKLCGCKGRQIDNFPEMKYLMKYIEEWMHYFILEQEMKRNEHQRN